MQDTGEVSSQYTEIPLVNSEERQYYPHIIHIINERSSKDISKEKRRYYRYP